MSEQHISSRPPHSGGGPPSREGRSGGPGAGPGGPRRGKRQYFRKKKVCRFCVERIDFIDYKKVEMLQPFVQDRGKIMPRRMTGTCSRMSSSSRAVVALMTRRDGGGAAAVYLPAELVVLPFES